MDLSLKVHPGGFTTANWAHPRNAPNRQGKPAGLPSGAANEPDGCDSEWRGEEGGPAGPPTGASAPGYDPADLWPCLVRARLERLKKYCSHPVR